MLFTEIYALSQLLLVGQVTPGPNNALLSSSGMRFGYRATQPHAWGVLTGHSFMEFMVALGLGNIYREFPIVETALTVIAVCLLSYLAYKIAVAPVDKFAEAKGHDKPWRFWQAFVFQWINPKAWLIAIGVSGAYASGEKPLQAALIIGAVTAMTGIISSQGWTIFGVWMRQVLNTPIKRRIFNVSLALLMIWSVVLLLKGH